MMPAPLTSAAGLVNRPRSWWSRRVASPGHIGIVGGCGFVGLNIAAVAAARGYLVTLFDRQPPPAGFAAAAVFAEVDVTAPETLSALAGRGIEVLFSGSAITSGAARDAAEPERVLAVNLLGFVNVLRAARASGVRLVVNLSSVAAYGAAGARHDPLVEDETPSEPQTLYALSKFATEVAAARLAALWEMDIRSVRLSSLFGPWERATGVRDTLSPHLQLLEAAEEGRAALLPHAGLRDWTYAPDAAAAVLALAMLDRPKHGLHNISRGVASSVLDFGQALRRHWPDLTCRLAVPGETPNIDMQITGSRGSLSIARLQHEMAGAAAFRDPISVVDETVAWWRDQRT
jgi:UDP-glucose 4-epimerase